MIGRALMDTRRDIGNVTLNDTPRDWTNCNMLIATHMVSNVQQLLTV